MALVSYVNTFKMGVSLLVLLREHLEDGRRGKKG